jgi:transposase
LKSRAKFFWLLGRRAYLFTNNAADGALCGLALGRKPWLFASSERGAERAAVGYTLIQTAKLYEVDAQAWARIAGQRRGNSTSSSLTVCRARAEFVALT